MKVSCTQENIARSLSYLDRVVGKQSTLPILSNFLIETEKGRLKISATNLEIGVVSWLPCKVIEEGEITVPAKILGSIVNNINSDKLNLETKKNNVLNIETESYKADLKLSEEWSRF